MKIGILGSGDVGKALGRGFILAGGNSVIMGSREDNNPKAMAWCKEMEGKGTCGTFSKAAKEGEIIVLATLGSATEEAIQRAGLENFKGKLVMDATNPLDFSQGMPPRLLGGIGDSGGERHQRLLPGAQVVKVFNSVGNALMFRPEFEGTLPSMFICGNDDVSKQKVAKICADFGWETVDVGQINSSHYLEAMCMVWVLSALKTNTWNQAFKLMKK